MQKSTMTDKVLHHYNITCIARMKTVCLRYFICNFYINAEIQHTVCYLLLKHKLS